MSAPYYDPELTLRQLVDERVTVAFANFPAFYLALGTVLASSRWLPSASAADDGGLPGGDQRIRKLFPGVLQISVWDGPGGFRLRLHQQANRSPQQRATTAGRPIDCIEFSIRDPELLKRLQAGETGEIWLGIVPADRVLTKDPQPVLTGPPFSWLVPHWGRWLGRCRGPLFIPQPMKDMLKVGGGSLHGENRRSSYCRTPPWPWRRSWACPTSVSARFPWRSSSWRQGMSRPGGHHRVLPGQPWRAIRCRRAVPFISDWPTSATKIQKGVLREFARQPG